MWLSPDGTRAVSEGGTITALGSDTPAAELGPVNHVVIQQAGNYAAMKQEPVPVPPGLDWDAWQVDAPKKPFKMGYTSFRSWWEYGSGLVGDWGAHHIDGANWVMDADAKQPRN